MSKQEEGNQTRDLRHLITGCAAFLLPEHPKETHFSIESAHALAQCSALTYLDTEHIQDIAHNQWGFSQAEVFDRKHARGVVLAKDDCIVVAFRGSHKWEDFLNSALVWPMDKGLKKFMEKMPVHDGVLKYLNAKSGEEDTLWEAIDASCKSYQATHPQARIYLTGHSLGGSIAMLASERLVDAGEAERIAGMYTFGQPRTGEAGFAAKIDTALKDRYFRVVNHNDFLAGYPGIALAHGGQKTTLTPLGDVSVDGQPVQGSIVSFLEQGKNRSIVDKSYLVAAGIVRKPKITHSAKSYLCNMEFALATRREHIPDPLLEGGQWKRVLYGLASMPSAQAEKAR